MDTNQSNQQKMKMAEDIRQACIEAARQGFQDASMSGLCKEGAIEAAVSAMQTLELEQLIKNSDQ